MHLSRSILCVAVASLLSSCSEREPTVRHYREISVEAPPHLHRPEARELPALSESKHLAWTCPDGWTEQPGKDMRLATFLVGPDKAECTIVSFPGDAGGMKPNVRRWLGQLKMDVDDGVLDAFLKKQPAFTTSGGLPCTVFDFSELPVETMGTSMLAGMAAAGDQTVFIKLTGAAPLLAAEKDKFAALCASLAIRE